MDLFSTIFFAVTILLMIWEIRNQKKDTLLQIKGLQQDAYAVLRADHDEIVKKQIDENKDLYVVWNKVPKPDKIEWKVERKVFLFYVLIFDLYERIHWEIMKGNISDIVEDEEWGSWLNWLKRLSGHWIFEYTFDDVYDVYEKKFMKSICKKFWPEKLKDPKYVEYFKEVTKTTAIIS